MRGLGAASVALAASLALAGAAFAQGAGAPAQAEADALFKEGRDLLERGQYETACQKLQRSEGLAPAVGTLLNLGYCWEQLGRFRSAMDAYAEAQVLAAKANDAKRTAFARDRFAAVEPKAQKLVVRVVPPEAPGLEIRHNGELLARGSWDTPVAVDPAEVEISASAPGRRPWKGVAMARGEGSVLTVYVPPLEDTPPAPRAAQGAGFGARRVTAVVLWVAAAGSLAAGTAAALGAKQRYDDSLAGCDAAGCDPGARSAQRGAVVQGNVATALVGLGLAFAATGVYLWIVSRPPEAKAAALTRALTGGATF